MQKGVILGCGNRSDAGMDTVTLAPQITLRCQPCVNSAPIILNFKPKGNNGTSNMKALTKVGCENYSPV
jgi:hypothetical protein